MNLDRSAIVAIESNRRKVTADELKNFSELYNVSLEEIVYGKPNPVENKPSKISTLIKKFSNLSIKLFLSFSRKTCKKWFHQRKFSD